MEIARAKKNLDSYLTDAIQPEGWWPYKKGNGPSMEATAWCAFTLVSNRSVSQKACDYILKEQLEDGGWSTAPDTGFSDWVTGPALMALRQIEKNVELSNVREVHKTIDKGLLHLSDSRPVFYPVVGRLLLFLAKGPKGVHFERGWPWDPDCFHWIEPTSYHLFALKVPGLPEKEVFHEIVKHANSYILKRVCKGGGWNYGNRETLGAFLTPFRVTTAEALLALQDEDKNQRAIAESLEHLKSYNQEDTSTLGLAWSILCLNAYGFDYSSEMKFLLKRQSEDGSFSDNNMANAVSSLALACAEGRNPLKF